MVAAEFLNQISKFHLTTYAGVEDFADKFNFLLTVVVLSLCTTIVTVKQYILKPITCYISTEVGGSNLLNYVENYCWVQGTLPVSYDGRMPSSPEEWTRMEDRKILYYQWVPFLLGLQCILFYMPRLIWQLFCHNRTGADLENIVKQSVSAVAAKEKDRGEIISDIGSTIEHLLFQQQKRKYRKVSASDSLSRRRTLSSNDQRESFPHRTRSRCCSLFSCLSLNGNYIVTTYLLVKLLYLANAIGQLYLMQSFLGFNGSAFGVEVLDNILKGHDWEETLIFPRVGFCFVQMKIIGVQTNGVTAQCALPVNMLNEKIYVFLWWWILFAAFLTLLSLFHWIFRIFNILHEANYITKYIMFAENFLQSDERDLTNFSTLFLRRDGIFILRMIRMNAGDVISTAVVNCLWSRFLFRLNAGERNPLSNVNIPTTGWSTNLTKGGKTHDADVRNRNDYSMANETLYPDVKNMPSAPKEEEWRHQKNMV